MAITTLEFLNKNQFRRYPFKAETSLVSLDGDQLSNELIVGMSLSTTSERTGLYVSQVITGDGSITVAVSSFVDGAELCLGRFNGAVSENFSVLVLESFVPFVSGTMIVGSAKELIGSRKAYIFDSTQAALEESTVFYYTPPAVHSLRNKGNALRGHVEFGLLNNVQKTTEGSTIRLGTLVTLNINSLADQSSCFNNCKTPVIRYVNGAVPYYDTSGNYPDLQGNLFLVGVAPIAFYGGTGGGSLALQTVALDGNPLTLDTLCTARNAVLPPINPIYLSNLPNETASTKTFKGKENYYTKSYYTPVNFITTGEPEFLSWPQFFANWTKIVVSPTAGATAQIVTVPTNTTGTAIRRLVLRNSGGATIQATLRKNGTPCPGYQEMSLGPDQAIVVSGDSSVTFQAGDIFTLYFDSVQSSGGSLQVVLFYR